MSSLVRVMIYLEQKQAQPQEPNVDPMSGAIGGRIFAASRKIDHFRTICHGFVRTGGRIDRHGAVTQAEVPRKPHLLFDILCLVRV